MNTPSEHSPSSAAAPAPAQPSRPALAQPAQALGWWEILGNILLSDNHRQRVRITRSMGSMLAYVVYVVLSVWAHDQGMLNADYVAALQAGLVGWIAFIYIWLRSGLNQRMQDPWLTLPQIMGAQVWLVASYLTFAPLRGSVLLPMGLVLVFGVFNLDRRGRGLVYAYTLALFGSAMLGAALVHPDTFSPHVELGHFLLVVTMLPAIAILGGQVSSMRERFLRQKNDLTDALARIHEMAVRDELTGLYNRRHMLEMIDHHVRRMKRANIGFCLCVLDLDHFKRINDSYGHGVGDDVLRSFAGVITNSLREADVVARWGGEEFMVLLPETKLEHAAMCMQRIRTDLGNAPLSAKVPTLRVSFSGGATEFAHEDHVEAAIERVNRALSSAKSAGRDRVCLI